MSIPILPPPVRRWCCPNCSVTDVTREAEPHTRFHTCSGLGGITAPMVQEGVRAKIIAVPRQDYLNGDLAQYDEHGRAIMAVTTERENGLDCAVLASTAVGKVSA